jgi:hypothetical protein
MTEPAAPRYVEPGWFTRRVFNPFIAWLTRAGVSVWGSRELRVRGLVAPRGQTQWVKNLRVAGEGELRVGHHTEPFGAEEVADDDKVTILRAYLKRWKLEVGVFFDGVSATSPDAELRRIAPDHPVFRITSRLR